MVVLPFEKVKASVCVFVLVLSLVWFVLFLLLVSCSCLLSLRTKRVSVYFACLLKSIFHVLGLFEEERENERCGGLFERKKERMPDVGGSDGVIFHIARQEKKRQTGDFKTRQRP